MVKQRMKAELKMKKIERGIEFRERESRDKGRLIHRGGPYLFR